MIPERDFKNKDTHFYDLSSQEQFNVMLDNLNRNNLDLKERFKELDEQAEKEIKRESFQKSKDVSAEVIQHKVFQKRTLRYSSSDDNEVYFIDLKLMSVLIFFYFGVWLSNLFLGSGVIFLVLMIFYYCMLYIDVPFSEKWKAWKELKTRRDMLE